MVVNVKFFAIFREIVGEKEISVSARDVGSLREEILRNYLEAKGALFENYESKKLKEFVNFVNGRGIKELNGLNTPLKDGDTVAIFPPVAGIIAAIGEDYNAAKEYFNVHLLIHRERVYCSRFNKNHPNCRKGKCSTSLKLHSSNFPFYDSKFSRK